MTKIGRHACGVMMATFARRMSNGVVVASCRHYTTCGSRHYRHPKADGHRLS